MTDWSGHTGFLALYVTRLRFYSRSLIQAQELGSPSGFDDKPWDPHYQRQAVKIYTESLPADYLERLASVFAGCVRVMDTQHEPPNLVAGEWQIVRSYFANATAAIAAAGELSVQPRWEDPTDQEPVTPSVVRFDLLAGFVAPEGADNLWHAANTVVNHLRDRAEDQHLERHHLSMLRCLAAGDPVVDIAHSHGFSRSGYYREANEIYRLLGVANRQQAVALAGERGWL